jgi:hypothetical protein
MFGETEKYNYTSILGKKLHSLYSYNEHQYIITEYY